MKCKQFSSTDSNKIQLQQRKTKCVPFFLVLKFVRFICVRYKVDIYTYIILVPYHFCVKFHFDILKAFPSIKKNKLIRKETI